MAATGYILSIFCIDCIGRKRLQLFGFAGEAIIFGYMSVNVVRKHKAIHGWLGGLGTATDGRTE